MPARRRDFWVRLALLWLAGNCLRVTLLAVPPLLPAIHRQLHLNETAVGALTVMPLLLLAAAAVPGSLLVARLGARRALVSGLFLVAVAGALRGLGPSTLLLFAMTFVMGVGVAVSQPALPSLVRQWFARQSGFATGVYSNGLLTGEIVAAALTVPLILRWVGFSWPLALLAWSVPVAICAVVILLWTPHATREPGIAPARWWPDWRSGRTWRLGLTLGGASAAYWGTNAFVPDYLKAMHHPGLVTAALTSVNLMQLPSSLLVAALSTRLVAYRWPFVASGSLTLLAAAGLILLPGKWVVGAAGLLGFATALVFVLTLALPPLLAEVGDVHRLSAAVFTITYACPFVASIIGGGIWDATRIPATSFTPVVLGGLMMVGLAAGLDLSAGRTSNTVASEVAVPHEP